MQAIRSRVSAIHSAKVVIDWSDIFAAEHANPQQSADVEKLVSWVESYPKKSDIQVRLQAKPHHEPSRKLQRRLQSIGCRVVATYTVHQRA